MIVAYVGRCADGGDAVLLGLTRHRDAVLEALRAVVEPGQDVAMKIDHGWARLRLGFPAAGSAF